MKTQSCGAVIPFGKHRGKSVDEVRAVDPQYLEWASAQPWFREKFESIYVSIVNVNAGEPAETPEHNAMQVRFLEPEYVEAFIRSAFADAIAAGVASFPTIESIREMVAPIVRVAAACDEARRAAKPGHWPTALREAEREQAAVIRGLPDFSPLMNRPYFNQVQRAFNLEALRALGAIERATVTEKFPEAKFEVNGIDVVLGGARFGFRVPPFDGAFESFDLPRCAVEIKPTLGDDFPAAIRQINRYCLGPHEQFARALLVGEYTGVGATRDQFVRMAMAAGVRVIFAADVEPNGGAR